MSAEFRGAGFSPDADRRAQPAAAPAAFHRRRHLRNQARRRIPDVEPVHRSRDRTGAAWARGARQAGRGARCRRRRPRARLHRAGGAAKPDVRIAGRGRCAGRGDRMARAGADAARAATDRRSALPPGPWRLLRDVAFGGRDSIRVAPGRRFDAVLVDIDHSPQNLLHPRHAALYRREGWHSSPRILRPGGVFALWSNDPPEEAFSAVLASVFANAAAHVVSFDDWQGRCARPATPSMSRVKAGPRGGRGRSCHRPRPVERPESGQLAPAEPACDVGPAGKQQRRQHGAQQRVAAPASGHRRERLRSKTPMKSRHVLGLFVRSLGCCRAGGCGFRAGQDRQDRRGVSAERQRRQRRRPCQGGARSRDGHHQQRPSRARQFSAGEERRAGRVSAAPRSRWCSPTTRAAPPPDRTRRCA